MKEMGQIKGVAFDLEGTTVDVERAHHNGFLRTAAEVGLLITFEQALRQIHGFVGGGDSVICAQLSEMCGGKKSVEEIRLRKMVFYREIIATMDIAPRPGFLEVFKYLSNRRLGMAIGSLTYKEQAEVLLKRSGVGPLFQDGMIVLREDVKNPKPAPDVFLETARRMRIFPSEQLVFEDSPTGVVAAMAAGSMVVAVPVYDRQEILSALIEAGASKVFLDWKEVYRWVQCEFTD